MNKKAFSLLEVVFAVVILGVAISALIAVFFSSSVVTSNSRQLTNALSHAQYVMEEIRAYNGQDLESKINSGDWDWQGTDITARGLTSLPQEAIDTQVSLLNDLYTINVTVTWQDRQGRGRQVNLTTLKAR